MPMPPERGPVLKTPFLLALDRIGNTATRQSLLSIQKLLRSGESLMQVYAQLAPSRAAVSVTERDHVASDWFGNKKGAWRAWQGSEDVLRQGIIQAISLQTKKRGKPLPVDYWWVRDAPPFRVLPFLSSDARTVTVLLLTAQTPTPGPAVTAAGGRARRG
ncbi:MAG TPA: hypothetical protein VKU41_13180 [Polyangiaceae bacterium]|nr:hypothetical protein [Polyangiaceae bacterium]